MIGSGDHELQILAFEIVGQESRVVPKTRFERGEKGTKLFVRFSVATREGVDPKFARVRRRDLGGVVALTSFFVPRVAFFRFCGVGARFGAFLRKLASKFARIDAKTRRKALQRAENSQSCGVVGRGAIFGVEGDDIEERIEGARRFDDVDVEIDSFDRRIEGVIERGNRSGIEEFGEGVGSLFEEELAGVVVVGKG